MIRYCDRINHEDIAKHCEIPKQNSVYQIKEVIGEGSYDQMTGLILKILQSIVKYQNEILYFR